jgi:Flp pilus assembly pilin Flp
MPARKGQGLIEYALILIFVALAVIIVLTTLGPPTAAAFSQIIASI